MRKREIDFSKFSSIKIGSTHPVEIIESCEDLRGNHFIIGLANNLLVTDTPPPLAILSKKFDFIDLKDGVLRIGASTPSGKIFSFCKKQDIGGFEFLHSLPGSLGGLLYMNAGMGEVEISKHLLDLTSCKGVLTKDEAGFGYRKSGIGSLILEANFEVVRGFSHEAVEFFKAKRLLQPNKPSAGSCFKNPPDDYAGRLIEAVGLKGYRVGGASFSSTHANFLVNLGGATPKDALMLIDEAKRRVKESFGVDLECEIGIV